MSRRISRRTVLRGAGGLAFTLPFLESLDARAQAAPPKRFVAMSFPNGVFTSQWFPTAGASETDFTLAASHAALEPLKPHCLWLSGVDLAVAVLGPGEQHQRGMGALLTGAQLGQGNFVGNDGSMAGWALGPSVDQVLVGQVGSGSRAASLQLGVKTSKRDVSGVLSYAAANQPLLPQNDPVQIFHTLFMDSGTDPTSLAAIRLRRKSVLDAVLAQFNALSAKVPASERARLDEHATRVRELELRVTAPPTGPQSCSTAVAPPSRADGYESEAAMPEAARLEVDLLALAFSCDLTRVATLAVADAQDHLAMPFLNIASDLHNISHYGDTDPLRAQLATRDAWVVGRFAALLTALQGLPEGGGTVLDNTLVLLGSELSRGNLHSHQNMPFVLAGHATGWRMGRFLQYTAQPHNDLLVSILRGFGGSQTTFGDPGFCTGPLGNLS